MPRAHGITLDDTRHCTTCQNRKPGAAGHWIVFNGGRNRRWECNCCKDNKEARAQCRVAQGATASATA